MIIIFSFFTDSGIFVQNITISSGQVGTVHTGPSNTNVRESSSVTIGDNVKMNIHENQSSCKLNNLKISDAYFFPGHWKYGSAISSLIKIASESRVI